MDSWTVLAPDAWDPIIKDEMRRDLPPQLKLVFADEHRDSVLADADFLLAGPEPVTGDLLRSAPRLNLIHKWGIGVDSIDLVAARDEGVGVAITAAANSHAVAEHALMMMLATLRQLPYADHKTRAGQWVFTEMRARCRQLSGRTVGIVGLGNIGRAVARRLAGFETDIVYYDPVRPTASEEQKLGVRFCEMQDLLATADVVTLHFPGGHDNYHLVDASMLAAMRPGAILINTARGEILDTGALVSALTSGRLAGAGLDVFEDEPLTAPHPLLNFENVVLTPHTAASVLDNVPRVARHAYDNMLRVINGDAISPADSVVPVRRRPHVTSTSEESS